MSTYAHDSGARLVTGKIQQILHVVSGRAVVLKKGQRADEDATDYLLSSEANAAHLQKGIGEFERGEGLVKALR